MSSNKRSRAKIKVQRTSCLKSRRIELTVRNRLGIHGRPAAQFAKVANEFECMIFVEKDGELVNAKSIVGLMLLAAGPRAKLLIRARGRDAGMAVKALQKLVLENFGEG